MRENRPCGSEGGVGASRSPPLCETASRRGAIVNRHTEDRAAALRKARVVTEDPGMLISRTRLPEPQIFAREVGDRFAAHQFHVSFDFGADQAESTLHTGLAGGGERMLSPKTSVMRKKGPAAARNDLGE